MYDVTIGADGAPLERADAREAPEPQNERPLVAALVLIALIAVECGAAFAASRLHFAPKLGAPAARIPVEWQMDLRVAAILLLGVAGCTLCFRASRPFAAVPFALGVLSAVCSVGVLYSPLQVVAWQAEAARSSASMTVYWQAWTLSASVMIAGSGLAISGWRSRRALPSTTSHGSAHWAPPGVLAMDEGILLGRSRDLLLRLPGEGHILTIAPTRSGKGVSCVIPNLLDHNGSVLVTDPKGENYAVTSKWRLAQGQTVHALDPFGVVDGQARYNPLDLVDVESKDAADDARMLADMIVLPEGREGDQAFWNEEARGILTGLILHAAASPNASLRTLTHVRTLLTLPPDSFAQLLKEMSESLVANGLVARAAARILQKADRERSGVISTAQSHTHFLDSPRMTTTLGSSTFEFADLKRSCISVYLILPTDRIDGYARWLRLMIACGLLAVYRTPGQPSVRMLFLLDEFAHLRRMHPVQRDIGLAGGYGVRFWLVLQDLSQLRSTYTETWQTFLANVDVLQAFGTNDWDTAEYLSKMTGDATIHVASENRSTGVSRGRHSQRQHGTGWSRSETGRRLLFPDEVRRLSLERQLLFVKGTEPLLVDRLNNLTDAPFRDRADAHPLYEPVG